MKSAEKFTPTPEKPAPRFSLIGAVKSAVQTARHNRDTQQEYLAAKRKLTDSVRDRMDNLGDSPLAQVGTDGTKHIELASDTYKRLVLTEGAKGVLGIVTISHPYGPKAIESVASGVQGRSHYKRQVTFTGPASFKVQGSYMNGTKAQPPKDVELSTDDMVALADEITTAPVVISENDVPQKSFTSYQS